MATCLELVNFNENFTETSVTSSTCIWKKKLRKQCDDPVEMSKLPTLVKESSTRSEAPCSEYYDPCLDIPLPSVDDFYYGLKALRLNANIMYNPFPFGNRDVKTTITLILVQSFFEKINDNQSIYDSSSYCKIIKLISFTPTDIQSVERNRHDQVDNIGLVTAKSC